MKTLSFGKRMMLIAGMLCLLPGAAAADGMPEAGQDVKYTVKEGDTLWDISAAKLKDPFHWERLWKANPHIKDPHWIYPGQHLVIPASLAGEPAPAAPVTASATAPATVATVEKIDEKAGKAIIIVEESKRRVITPQKGAAKMIPLRAKGYLASRELFLTAGMIDGGIAKTGSIIGFMPGRTITGGGDTLFIKSQGPLSKDTKFYIISPPEKIQHPDTKEVLGYLTRVKGIVEWAGEDNGYQKAVILEAYEEITTEDSLADYFAVEPPEEPTKPRSPQIDGKIVKVRSQETIAGKGDIAYIDRGRNSDIRSGDLFSIISRESPNITIGTAQVLKVNATTSVALVKRAEREVKAGDIFKN